MNETLKKDTEFFSLFKKLVPYLALAILLSLSVATWLFLKNLYVERAQRRFNEHITEKISNIADRLGQYKMILQGGVGLFMASEDVSRAAWRAYVEYSQIRTLYPGVQGVGFSKVIRPAEWARHIRSIRAEGFPDYTVWPEGNRDEYTAIIYLEPFDADNQRAFGYDMFSEPVRRAAMTRTRDTGEVSLSGRVTLVQNADQDIQPGFLLYVPVYLDGMSPHSHNERRAAIQGYVYAPFRMDVLMEGIFPKIDHKIDFILYAGADISPAALMFDSHVSPGSADERRRPMLSATRTLDLYGHQWTLAIETAPLFEAEVDFYIPKLILGSGIIISLLIFLLFKMFVDSGRRAESLARKMTLDLRQSEENIRLITEYMEDMVWLSSKDNSTIRFISPSYEKITGRSRQKLYDRQEKFMEIVHPEDLHAVKLKFEEYKKSGRLDHEYRILNTNGQVRWVHSRGFPIIDDNGHVINHFGVATDITERKQSDEVLRRMSELLSISGRIAKIGGWELNLETQRMTWTEETYRIHEVDPSHRPDLATSINFYTPESQPIITAAVQAAIETGESYDLDLQLITARGKTIWVRALGIAERRDGETVRLLGAFQDITERKQAENDLRVSEAQFRSLVDNSPIGFALIDPEGRFLEVNAALCQMIGYPKDELLQTTSQVITHPHDLDTDASYVRRMLNGEIDIYRIRKRYIHKDGHTVWGLLCVSRSNKKDGSPSYFISQVVDISAEKQSEQNHIAMLAAEAANRQKSQFLSNMSHEIRTPMNAIMGFAQVLDRDPSLTPGQKKQIRIIIRSGHHLLRLIDDILDISRIEAGRIELNPIIFGLDDFLDDMENMFRSRTEAKGLQLIVERDAGLPGWVRGDEGKLRQVLVNLLGNAVKFTESGEVSMRARSEPVAKHTGEDAKPLRLVFEIEDSGPGVPASEQERIFTAFEQVASEHIIEGTGLGLAISRKLVEMMGGTLTVDSVVGKGSCFHVRVLCEPAEAIQKSEASESPNVVGLELGSGPWRVLVVDDVPSNRDLLDALLSPLGFEIREAENGAEAIDIFEAWAPHVVLMDMRMPVMDGYEATRRIKATETGRTTPVIAVTASVLMGGEDEVLAMGVSAYLHKPFKPEELYETLGECLDLRYVYADEPSEAPRQPKAVALTPEALSALPRDLLQAMAEAVAEGDTARLAELIRRVEPLDSTTAQGLQALAGRYDYTTLTELLKKGENDNE